MRALFVFFSTFLIIGSTWDLLQAVAAGGGSPQKNNKDGDSKSSGAKQQDLFYPQEVLPDGYRTCMDNRRGSYDCTGEDPMASRRALDELESMRLKDVQTDQKFKPAFPSEIEGVYNLGVQQRVDGTPEEKAAIRRVITLMVDYFQDEVLSQPIYANSRNRCANYYELCSFWASIGECESNRLFMVPYCAAACRLCLVHNSWLREIYRGYPHQGE